MLDTVGPRLVIVVFLDPRQGIVRADSIVVESVPVVDFFLLDVPQLPIEMFQFDVLDLGIISVLEGSEDHFVLARVGDHILVQLFDLAFVEREHGHSVSVARVSHVSLGQLRSRKTDTADCLRQQIQRRLDKLGVFHISVRLVPLLGQVRHHVVHRLVLFLVELTLLSAIRQNSLLEQKLLHSDEHTSLDQVLCFRRLLENMVKAVNECVLESLRDVLVHLLIEKFVIFSKLLDFLINLFEISLTQFLIGHQLLGPLSRDFVNSLFS